MGTTNNMNDDRTKRKFIEGVLKTFFTLITMASLIGGFVLIVWGFNGGNWVVFPLGVACWLIFGGIINTVFD
jgi:hypothetical protein